MNPSVRRTCANLIGRAAELGQLLAAVAACGEGGRAGCGSPGAPRAPGRSGAASRLLSEAPRHAARAGAAPLLGTVEAVVRCAGLPIFESDRPDHATARVRGSRELSDREREVLAQGKSPAAGGGVRSPRHDSAVHHPGGVRAGSVHQDAGSGPEPRSSLASLTHDGVAAARGPGCGGSGQAPQGKSPSGGGTSGRRAMTPLCITREAFVRGVCTKTPVRDRSRARR
jgi:hypothetical protein